MIVKMLFFSLQSSLKLEPTLRHCYDMTMSFIVLLISLAKYFLLEYINVAVGIFFNLSIKGSETAS